MNVNFISVSRGNAQHTPNSHERSDVLVQATEDAIQLMRALGVRPNHPYIGEQDNFSCPSIAPSSFFYFSFMSPLILVFVLSLWSQTM